MKEVYNLTTEIIPIELVQSIHKDTYQQEIKRWEEKAGTWEKDTRAELNAQLIEKGYAKKVVYAADMKEHLRSEILNACNRLSKEFEEAGYMVWDYMYSYSNKEKWFSIDIKA